MCDKATPLILSIALAAILWTIMFVVRPFNFWLMMSISTLTLTIVSLTLNKSMIQLRDVTCKNILLGVISAIVFYAIFRFGNIILFYMGEHFPGLLPHRAENIQSVYANRGVLSRWIVGLLLFFPIGFGEEVFWRGYVQNDLQRRMNKTWALLLTVLLYTAVHLPTGNPVLLLAALVCGLAWGGLYHWCGSIVPVLISHMIWDPVVFVILPLN